MVRDALKTMGYTPGQSALSQVAPAVTSPTGNDTQDEIKASRALKRIEKAAIKKAAAIKFRAIKKGVHMPLSTAAKKAVTKVVAAKAPRLLTAARRAA
jgi:hypothetical protein